MTSPVNRRSFLQVSARALAATTAPLILGRRAATAAESGKRIKKALGYAMIKGDGMN